MSKFCPNCGNELADDVRFCNRCGYKIVDTSNSVVQQNTDSETTSNSSTSNKNEYKPKSVNFLQDQAAKIDEEKKKSNSKTTIIVVIIVSLLVIAAIILSVYVLFFTDSKDDNSSSLSSNNSIKNSSSQTDSSKNDSNLSDLSLIDSSSSSEPDSSSEPEIEIVPVQKRDIEFVVVKKDEDGNEKYDSKQYTTLINADDKSVKDCLNKLKADKQAVVSGKSEKGLYPTLSSSYILEDAEKHTPIITITTSQKEEFFKNANKISITFKESKLVDKKDEILKSLLDPELAEYIINGEVDKSLDFNMSYYLNDKAIKVNYERAKKDKDYVINITYTVMSNTDDGKEARDGQNHIDTEYSLLNNFKAPLSSFFTTKSKDATDFDSIRSNKSLFDSALKTLVADNPIVVSSTNFSSVEILNDGTQKLVFKLCGYYKESRPADQCNVLDFEFKADSKNIPTLCEITMSISTSKNEDALKKAFENTTKLLYPDLKVNNEGVGEITMNGKKYKVTITNVSPLVRKITISLAA